MLSAVGDVIKGGHVNVTPALRAAVDAAVEEWRQTLADLEAVDTSDVADADAWQQQIDLAADRVQGFERRAVALVDAEQDALDAVFTPTGAFRIHLGNDLTPLGLANRDCFAIGI